MSASASCLRALSRSQALPLPRSPRLDWRSRFRALEGVLSTQELSQLASPSTVNLRCEGKTGSGFFVAPERVLTNAHVVCPSGTLMEVVLPDGRQLVGETVEQDEELDLATVRVVGARAQPLKLGDATRLQPGDKLVFIGSPKGLVFTVHEGKVSFVGRQYLGIGYVQFNASVNPGNSGGPLLNGQGEVVGVVSMKIEDADGLGLALPVQYASKLVPAPSSPEAVARWEELLARVAREEERDIERLRLDSGRPMLISVRSHAELGLVALLIEHFDQSPARVTRRMEIQADGGTCALSVDFERWVPVLEAMSEEQDSRRLRWFVSHGLTQGLYVSAARLPVETCALAGKGKAWVKVEQGAKELDRAQVSMEAVESARATWTQRKVARESWERQVQQQRRDAEERSRQQAEGPWRSAFRQAREQLSRLEQEKRRWQQEDAAGRDVRGRLTQVEEALKRAREQLADLERQASQQSVPREWRQ